MPYRPNKHRRHAGRIRGRRSIRLKGYDYTRPGAYFITIVTKNRECLFGEITKGEMRLNEWGRIAHAEWLKTADIRREIELDEFVIMPNHIHAIIFIVENGNAIKNPVHRLSRVMVNGQTVGAHGRAPLRRVAQSLGSLIAGYKSIVTKRINQSRAAPGMPVWQRNYHEHIIRNGAELARIREYIRYNPLGWEKDKENPARPRSGNT
jgi:putative transposase